MIRKTTERPEIEYCVLEYDKENGPSVQEIAVAKALEYTKDFDFKSRGIIFSRSKEGADSVAKKLNCSVSRTGLSAEELQENFENWLSGKSVWMAATSGFSNGIDYSDVAVVIFMEPPYGLTDFVQGSGRGGRSGRPSKTLLITSWKNTGHDDEEGKHWKCVRHMQDWIDRDTICRRQIISLCMDGKAISCQDISNSVLCDVCSGVRPVLSHSTSIPPPASIPTRFVSPGYSDISPSITPIKSKSADTEHYALYEKRANAYKNAEQSKDNLSEKLSVEIAEFVKEHCIICYVLSGKKVPQDHLQLKRCIGDVPDYGWKDFKQFCNFPKKYAYCYFCWTPQEYEPRCHVKNYNGDKGCNLRNLLCLCAWTVYHDKRLRDMGERKYGWNKDMTLNEFGGWLAKESKPEKFNNAIDLFLFIKACYNHKK